MTDIVIPLSTQSITDNLELRVALRSIQRNATNLGTIHIYTAANIPWLRNCNVINMGDPIRDLKDANLINKIKAAASNPDVAQNFIFWSDDQVLTGPMDLDKAPVVYNVRNIQDFQRGLKQHPEAKWYRRMIHTFEYIREHTGLLLPNNYDAHTPQPYSKSKVLEIFNEVPYHEQPGFCINTIYYGMQSMPPSVEQNKIKSTFEKGHMAIPRTLKTYAGYDDASWSRGGAYFFLGLFFEMSKYEAE